jgi:hypothetical protein
MFQCHPRVDGESIEVFELPDATHDVIFNRLRKGDIVRTENQFHARILQPHADKIQRNSFTTIAWD